MRLPVRLCAMLAAAALSCLAAGGAEARWRVVGPGMAVADAEEGAAALAVECEGRLVLAAYGLPEDLPAETALLLDVDGERFDLSAVSRGRRVALSEVAAGEGISAELRRRLEEGRRAALSGGPLASLPAGSLSFSLRGSQEAFAAVERACG